MTQTRWANTTTAVHRKLPDNNVEDWLELYHMSNQATRQKDQNDVNATLPSESYHAIQYHSDVPKWYAVYQKEIESLEPVGSR